MKKALSLFLAVLMLFSCFAVNASAEGEDPHDFYFTSSGVPANSNQCVVVFNPLGGTFRDAVVHYDYTLDKPKVAYGAAEYSGTLVVVPSNSLTMTGGSVISLPVVAPADTTLTFVGWEIIGYSRPDSILPEGFKSGNVYAGGTPFILPSNCGGEILTFNARYTAGVAEEDTLGTILGVLIKVFGAIIGILMYQGDTEAGAALMEKVLGGIL